MRAIAVIETVSNQSFIFGTNRLREIVGASEMIYAAGVDLVLRACGYTEEIKQARERGRLRDINNGKGKWNDIQFLLVTSGKAILIGERERVEEIIREVTAEALARMPGITVRGGIARIEGEGTKGLHEAIKAAHDKLAGLRSRIPSNDLRFQRLPVVAECTSSGLPAWGRVEAQDEAMRIVSEPVCAKRKHRMKGWKRLTGWLKNNSGHSFAGNIDDLEQHMQGRDARWVAVIHADGNGVGQIFIDFHSRAKAKDQDDYIRKYRAFSQALEDCTLKAVEEAIARVNWPKGKFIPLIPLVLGGDDLTVICDGASAVSFTQAYLEAFERNSQEDNRITDVREDGLTAGAGISIVKPHFPFHRAYELAEELARSAKSDKSVSALHYHVHYDSSGADWERIKAQLDVPGNAHLSVQPWAVSCEDADVRNIERLWRGIAALKATDDDRKPRLPRGQQHALREALFAGKAIADARLRRIKHRYPDVKWDTILPGKDSLFVKEDGQFITPLLDMMDMADLMDAAEIERLVEKYRKKEQPA